MFDGDFSVDFDPCGGKPTSGVRPDFWPIALFAAAA
jgi:hypothetical protein